MAPTDQPNRPPGPAAKPLLGNALQAHPSVLDFLTENARTYGDVVHWTVFGEPIYQLNHPEHVEEVLVERNTEFRKSHLTRDVLGPVVENGLFTSEGDLWRRQRRLIGPLFHPDQIARYGDVMVDRTERRLDGWQDGDRIDVHDEMMALTVEIVAETLLGVDLSRDIRTIGRNLETVLEHLGSVWFHLRPSWLPTPANRRFERAVDQLETIVYRIIEERRSEAGGEDVVSRLVAAGDEEGEPMPIEQMRDEVMTFLIAGHETTALALTYSLYLLATHPAAEARLVEELHDELDGDPPTTDTVGDLAFTDRVVTEALRLYPPVSRVHREPVEDVVIDGYDIPAGATISLPQWVVHRDPRWYPDPLAFQPGRWTGELREGLPGIAYFPFAAGPRRCVGDQFARLEARLALATILQRFHLEVRPETSLEVEAAVSTRPTDPVWATVRERGDPP